jgi:aspartate/methionine/tyrosine aminotransferase
VKIYPSTRSYLATFWPIWAFISPGTAGGEFIYSAPSYTALVDAVGPGGGAVVGVPLDRDFQNDLAAIEASVNSRTRDENAKARHVVAELLEVRVIRSAAYAGASAFTK